MKTRNIALSALLLLFVCLWAALPLWAFADAPGLGEVVPGEVLVGVRQDRDDAGAPARLSAVVGQKTPVGQKLDALSKIHAYRLKLAPGLAMQEALARLRQRADVLYAEPNSIVHAYATPNDSFYGYQYGPQITQTDRAWEVWQPLTPVVIAIVDTGVDNTHPDLTNKIDRDGSGIVGFNAFTHLRDNALDDHGHGTHCAGIAAAQVNNGTGIAGIAGWNGQAGSSDTTYIKIMPVKALDSTGTGTDKTVTDGIVWAADHGARVISLSLGTSTYSNTVYNAVQYAWGRGCVLVAAAGNNASSALSYPAAYDNVISVAATDASDTLASFSNYGSWVKVAAPGVAILSTVPGSSYAFADGTSAAAPHVAGEAALILAQNSRNSTLSNSQVSSMIITRVDPCNGYQGRAIAAGAGRVNMFLGLVGGYHATSVAVGPDNTTHMLWDHASGQRTVWQLNTDGSEMSQSPAFSLGSGWTAKTIAVGSDHTARILWTHTSGQIVVERLNADGSTSQYPPITPDSGWTCPSIAVGPDNSTCILWTHAGGLMAVARLNVDGSSSQSSTFGPYSGSTAIAVSVGPDNTIRVLWNTTSGQASVWHLDTSGNYMNQSPVVGPYSGWTATALSVGPDNTPHVLWNHTSGQIVVWRFSVDGSTWTQSPHFGPFSGTTARAISVGPDYTTRLLWTTTTGQASVWHLDTNGNYMNQSPVFGPIN